MNLKNLFKSTPEQSPALKAMAARVSTMAGCQALEQELTQQRQALPDGSRASRQLRSKIEELQRVAKGLSVDEDRVRLAAVVKADQEKGTRELKAAEARLKGVTDAAALADGKRVERAALVDQLNQELSALHTQADQAVTAAEGQLREVITSAAHEAAAEIAAFDVFKKAQLHRATCGESLAVRVKGHETELRRLEATANDMAAQLQAAQDDVNLCRVKLARLAYDQAVQSLLDAYVKLRALPATDSSGKGHALSTIYEPVVTFASKDRALLGDRVCGESLRVRDWVLGDIARELKPANLALLTEPPGEEIPEQAAVPPSPHTFTPGSVEFENAKREQDRFVMGADRYEAQQRTDQPQSLQA